MVAMPVVLLTMWSLRSATVQSEHGVACSTSSGVTAPRRAPSWSSPRVTMDVLIAHVYTTPRSTPRPTPPDRHRRRTSAGWTAGLGGDSRRHVRAASAGGLRLDEVFDGLGDGG